jgi:polar amino acid transport system permease protein
MGSLKRIRPSNLVILVAAPFLVYLFAASSNYRRSLVQILGVEDRAGELFAGFLLLLAMLLLGCVLPFLHVRQHLDRPRQRLFRWLAAGANLALAAFVAGAADISVFVDSVVANSVDPFTSELIVKGKTPRQLTPEALAQSLVILRWGALVYLVLSGVLVAAGLLAGPAPRDRRRASFAFGALAVLNLAGLGYLLLIAHAGFASGLMVTLRAGVFAYAGAAVLGLVWAGLRLLRPKRWTLALHAGASLTLVAASMFFFLQPHETFVLVGSFEKDVAIVKGTPQTLVDAVRFGEYEGGDGKTVKTRSTATVDEALQALVARERVSAAFVPLALAPADAPVVWRVAFLPDRYKLPGFSLAILGVFLAILTFGAFIHGRHPLAVGSEFFIDVARGIPMLVIILYVGFPLSGAVKDATSEGINLPNMTRGIIALALGYSAYLAEIFRAGIEAVPRGQLEAARSLGLRNWQVARLVVLPQALRIVIPPLANEFIAILKDTSLLSILSVRDMLQRMREFQSAYFLVFPPYNTVAILYIVLTLSAASMLKWVERRYEARSH